MGIRQSARLVRENGLSAVQTPYQEGHLESEA
jgi:hypothetical protein